MPPSPAERFFVDRFGLATGELQNVLGSAVGRKADSGDLYFEFRESEILQLEDSLVKKAARNVSQGVGARVVAGDRTGYSYSDEVSVDRIRLAASTAGRIAETTTANVPAANVHLADRPGLYELERPPTDEDLQTKIDLLAAIDVAARSIDPRIRKVIATFGAEEKRVLIVRSDGSISSDVQPLLRLHVTCLAEDGRRSERGSFGGGGRTGLTFLTEPDPRTGEPRYLRYTREAAEQAVRNLDAVEAPAGSQIVVLGPGWPGILLHEAIGHGLEGDFNRKGVSAFSGRIGEKVASELCTVVDDGTLPNRRGSLNVDDEGTPTGRTVLIENGILRAYMQDRMNARLMDAAPTGNGRRESFAHIPMPRMTNTFMLAGQEAPEDVIRSVDHGLYAAYFGGGQVDITNGKFVFSATEAYLIEGGKITRPVKGATLIGSGPEVLKRITRVGSDLELDEGVGTCGKNGQGVPVGNGIPTVRIDGLTVGGTRA